MTSAWKPGNYPSVSVYMIVREAQGLTAFLQRVFQAEPLRRFDGPDGKILHSELRIDNSVVMISDAIPDYPAFPVWLHVYVPDVDATYRTALETGGKSVEEPKQKPGDPDRRGGFLDPCGNTWWISTQKQ